MGFQVISTQRIEVHSEAIPINTRTMDGSIWKQELKVKDKELEISTTVIVTLLCHSNSAEGSRVREEEILDVLLVDSMVIQEVILRHCNL